jgi:hypothetical protein
MDHNPNMKFDVMCKYLKGSASFHKNVCNGAQGPWPTPQKKQHTKKPIKLYGRNAISKAHTAINKTQPL